MLFLLALIPATALTAAGYVVLFLSHRAEGGLRTFGRYLAIWAFVLAGLVVLGGVFAAGCMHHAHRGMWGAHGPMRPWMERRDADRLEGREPSEVPPPPPPAAPAPAPSPPAQHP